MPNWLTATVVGRHQWNQRLCSLKLELNFPEFEAGQFINLGLDIDGKTVTRPYSLVNPPLSQPLEIYFNRVDTGKLSSRLFNAQLGDKLLCNPKPGGFFVLSQVPAAQQLWMCATGTAISPFLSMLRSVDPWESFERVILIHGIRDQSEQSYLKQLQDIKDRHPQQFDYFYSITREAVTTQTTQATHTTETTHFSQRIPALLGSGEIENTLGLTLTANNAQVMLCGNSGMVNECLIVLGERGLKKNQRRDPGQITIEIYQ